MEIWCTWVQTSFLLYREFRVLEVLRSSKRSPPFWDPNLEKLNDYLAFPFCNSPLINLATDLPTSSFLVKPFDGKKCITSQYHIPYRPKPRNWMKNTFLCNLLAIFLGHKNEVRILIHKAHLFDTCYTMRWVCI